MDFWIFMDFLQNEFFMDLIWNFGFFKSLYKLQRTPQHQISTCTIIITIAQLMPTIVLHSCFIRPHSTKYALQAKQERLQQTSSNPNNTYFELCDPNVSDKDSIHVATDNNFLSHLHSLVHVHSLKSRCIGNLVILNVLFISNCLRKNSQRQSDKVLCEYRNQQRYVLYIFLDYLNILDLVSLVLLLKVHGTPHKLLSKRLNKMQRKMIRLSFFKRQPSWANFIILMQLNYMVL